MKGSQRLPQCRSRKSSVLFFVDTNCGVKHNKFTLLAQWSERRPRKGMEVVGSNPAERTKMRGWLDHAEVQILARAPYPRSSTARATASRAGDFGSIPSGGAKFCGRLSDMKIRHIKVCGNWHYLSINGWEPFKFLGCSSWICNDRRWWYIRVTYVMKRHLKIAFRRVFA